MTQFDLNQIIVTIRKELEAEQQEIKQLSKKLQTAPAGKLLVARNKKAFQFYQRIGKGEKGRLYLSKKDETTLCRLAQKRYEEDLLARQKENFHILSQVLLLLQKLKDPHEVFSKMPAAIQPYITPIHPTQADYVQHWLADKTDLPSNADFHPENCIYLTENGEKVRSKSEMTIANLLRAMQLPYQYEKPLILNGNLTYPDFTILDVATQTEVYYEHFGLMDQEEYQTAALQKIEKYEKAGCTPGKQFLFSFESAQVPFNGNLVRMNLCQRFGASADSPSVPE